MGPKGHPINTSPTHVWTETQTCTLLDTIISDKAYQQIFFPADAKKLLLDDPSMIRSEQKICLDILKDTDWTVLMIKCKRVLMGDKGRLVQRDHWPKTLRAATLRIQALHSLANTIKATLGPVRSIAQLQGNVKAQKIWSEYLSFDPSWLPPTNNGLPSNPRRPLAFKIAMDKITPKLQKPPSTNNPLLSSSSLDPNSVNSPVPDVRHTNQGRFQNKELYPLPVIVEQHGRSVSARDSTETSPSTSPTQDVIPTMNELILYRPSSTDIHRASSSTSPNDEKSMTDASQILVTLLDIVLEELENQSSRCMTKIKVTFDRDLSSAEEAVMRIVKQMGGLIIDLRNFTSEQCLMDDVVSTKCFILCESTSHQDTAQVLSKDESDRAPTRIDILKLVQLVSILRKEELLAKPLDLLTF
ncbi:uncharacterized protein IL334_005998 [Kwoniella shivajii]|uniref:Uncharacterized protein n=1 Tax=Kwoniella shivajii TaxID=564305 RepID=A0ABZ1D598_9TREE|nr:hypothetical protein IL334_005998 [Kwoniella shivajii]